MPSVRSVASFADVRRGGCRGFVASAGGHYRITAGARRREECHCVGVNPTGRTDAFEEELARLRAENKRLLRLLEMTPQQARPPDPTQTGLFLDRPGAVTASSSAREKVGFFRRLFAARRDVYATRWENPRTGRSGWVPAVAGGWRKGSNRPYLPLTDDAVAAHLTGDVHVGLYPLLDGDSCHWLAADFDGPAPCSMRCPT
jgi:hypothetical protein